MDRVAAQPVCEQFTACESKVLPALSSQLFPNGTGYCNLKIKNIGASRLDISSLSLLAYYEPTVKLRDIIANLGGTETTGLEPDTILFNASVKFENSDAASYNINLTLNITNQSNTVVYNSTQAFTIAASSAITANFTGINTTGWSEGVYTLRAFITGDKTDNRTEYLTFKSVQAAANTVNYVCNGTIEYFNVTVAHPFNDSIEYNVSLSLPSGWGYSGSQLVTGSLPGNYTLRFNLTSYQTPENATINATIRYVFPLGISPQTISNKTELSLNSSAGITQAAHNLIRKYYARGVYANLTLFYFNTTSARTAINVTLNGNLLGTMPAANLSTSYIFTNVSVPWLNMITINITYQGDFTNITESLLIYGAENQKNASKQIEMSNSMPILEVVRETPKTVGNSREFYSRLSVHNKGCASATSVSFVEQISSGWTAYEQTMDAFFCWAG